MHIATAGPGARFAMTDRGRGALRQTSDTLTIGSSSMRWDGAALHVEVDEMCGLPRIGRLEGRITLTPSAVTGVELPLTPDGAHIWRPFAPTARIAVDLDAPGWRWEGHGYFDGNFGVRPMEDDFGLWTWARFPAGDGSLCIYDCARRDGTTLDAAMRFDADGSATMAEVPGPRPMGRTGWGLRRELRADPGTSPRPLARMLDAPFYARAVAETTIHGERLRGVHEVIDLRRFANPLMKPMLAFRVPRRARWRAARASA